LTKRDELEESLHSKSPNGAEQIKTIICTTKAQTALSKIAM
jgi:hypothetical protein